MSRRFFAIWLVLAMLCCCCVFSSAEEYPDVFSYDFHLHFHLNTEGFPFKTRSHIQGYAELLDCLSMDGNVTWCPKTESMDLQVKLIPDTNPDAAISFRLYGIPDYMCLTSPLLNGETLFIHNYAMMEFSEKTWTNFRIPLQYLALLDPFNTIGAFSGPVQAWKNEFGTIGSDRQLAYSKLEKIASAWESMLEEDYRLKKWISAVASLVENREWVEEEFAKFPRYLLNTVAEQKSLTAMVSDGHKVISNANEEMLLEEDERENESYLHISLPQTDQGYIPSLSLQRTETEETMNLYLQGSYSLSRAAARIESEKRITAGTAMPETMLDFDFTMEDIPKHWPENQLCMGELTIGGIVLPGIHYGFKCQCNSDGSFRLEITDMQQNNGEGELLDCNGTILETVPQNVPNYRSEELIQYFNIFSVNEQSLYAFMHRVARHVFIGILNFLNELPTKACQSVMDDLEDYGILELILR